MVQYSSTQISISHYFRITDRILIVNKTVIPMYRLKHYSNQGRNVRGYHHHQQIGRLRPAVALCTISLQPSLSCASRTASLMPILVSWRMSSQNRVLGRPLPLGPKTMPVRSTLSRLSLRRGGGKNSSTMYFCRGSNWTQDYCCKKMCHREKVFAEQPLTPPKIH